MLSPNNKSNKPNFFLKAGGICLWVVGIACAVGGVIARFYIVTPKPEDSSYLSKYTLPVDPMHFTDKYFYIAGLIIIIGSVFLILHLRRKNRLSNGQNTGNGKSTINSSKLSIICFFLFGFMVFLVVSLESSRPVYETILFSKNKSEITDEMQNDPAFFFFDSGLSSERVMIIRVFPQKASDHLVNILRQAGGYNSPNKKSPPGTQKFVSLLWLGTILFGFLSIFSILLAVNKVYTNKDKESAY